MDTDRIITEMKAEYRIKKIEIQGLFPISINTCHRLRFERLWIRIKQYRVEQQYVSILATHFVKKLPRQILLYKSRYNA